MVAIRNDAGFETAETAPRERSVSDFLVGTLRRAYDLYAGTRAACVLVTDDGQVFHLNTVEGSEPDWTTVADPFLVDLARFESRLVRVTFKRREESVFGPSLWGVRVDPI